VALSAVGRFRGGSTGQVQRVGDGPLGSLESPLLGPARAAPCDVDDTPGRVCRLSSICHHFSEKLPGNGATCNYKPSRMTPKKVALTSTYANYMLCDITPRA
jgi:hypothetical protein